jgi:uncharacterized protein
VLRPPPALLLAVVAVLVPVIGGCTTDGADDRGDDGAAAARAGTDDAGASVPVLPALHPEIDAMPATIVTIAGPGDAVEVAARVATSPEERRRGLMDVTELPDGTGMLFDFDAPRSGGFWMKDTLVPLDIAFADADGTILAILTMAPCRAEPCDVYQPGVVHRAALEVPAGWFERVGVAVGHRLAWSTPVPAPPSAP